MLHFYFFLVVSNALYVLGFFRLVGAFLFQIQSNINWNFRESFDAKQFRHSIDTVAAPCQQTGPENHVRRREEATYWRIQGIGQVAPLLEQCLILTTLNFFVQDFDKLNSFSKNNWKKDINQVDQALKGWNYGDCQVQGNELFSN